MPARMFVLIFTGAVLFILRREAGFRRSGLLGVVGNLQDLGKFLRARLF